MGRWLRWEKWWKEEKQRRTVTERQHALESKPEGETGEAAIEAQTPLPSSMMWVGHWPLLGLIFHICKMAIVSASWVVVLIE